MSEFHSLGHHRLNRDINLIKQLEMKQRQLEEKALNSKELARYRKFTAHPNHIHSDSDTTGPNTPRFRNNFSASTTYLGGRVYEEGDQKDALEETKQKAQNFHKLLHEKLSIIDSNPSERSDFSEIGDSYSVSQKRTFDRYQNRCMKALGSATSVGSSSLDSDGDLSICRKISHIKSNNKNDNIRSDTNYSSASKNTSGGEKRSIGNRLSQQSLGPRGLPVSVFERQFKAVVTKSMQNIAEIRSTLAKGIIPPDGDEDKARRLVRDKEFSNRFSRNYLYPLARQIKDLGSIDQMSQLVTNQKLLSTYQIIHNALQAYRSHLPTSLGDCTYNHLKMLMGNIVEVCGTHRSQLKDIEENYDVEFIDAFKINAELTLLKVEECLSSPAPVSADTALKSEESKITLTKYGDKTNRKQKNRPKAGGRKSDADKRLSMYTMTASFRKDPAWKKAVRSLASKKFNVQSKYRTATYKHRPPVRKGSEIFSLHKLKSVLPNKSDVLKPSRLNTPENEDCIKTMVEAELNGESHIEKEEWENMEKKSVDGKPEEQSNKEEILMKLLQFTLKSHKHGPAEDEKTQIAELLTLIKGESSDEFLKKVLDTLRNSDQNEKKDENKQQLTLEIVRSQYSSSDDAVSSREKTRRREPKITVTGDKNSQLICITDDNPVIEPPVEETVDNKKCQTENVEPSKIIYKTSSETQTELKEANSKATKGTQKGKKATNIKISRLKKVDRNLKPLKPLDKKQAVDAIQYKLDFYRYCKNNPMYKISTTCQPWILMSKISEELLNQCFLAVAREIEINDVVDKVYQSELQL